jgi:hypothetical protein
MDIGAVAGAAVGAVGLVVLHWLQSEQEMVVMVEMAIVAS